MSHRERHPRRDHCGSIRRMTKTLTAFVVALSLSTAAFADPQPNMKDALASLKAAKESLEKATADKGGHRAKAIAAVKEAIEQTEKGIAFDDKH